MKGRRPLPVSVKALKGTLRNCRIKNNNTYPTLSSVPPSFLSREAATEYRRAYKLLLDSGVLQQTDRAVFLAYCQSWARWQEAERILAQEGLVLHQPILNRHGEQVGTKAVKHPAINIAKDERAACVRAASLFGFNPQDRQRVAASQPTPQQSEYDAAWDEI